VLSPERQLDSRASTVAQETWECSKGGSARPARIIPRAAAAPTGISAVTVRGVFQRRKVGINAPGEPSVIPVAAPLENLAVHVIDAPLVARARPHLRRLSQCRTIVPAVAWLSLKIRLRTARSIAE
jgi:hypothetical protein